METTNAKWNTRPQDFKVWQVAQEIGRFANEVSVKLMNAIAQPPLVGDTLAMEDPAKIGTVGHLFQVVDVRELEGDYWHVGLRQIPHVGFIALPPRITPLAYHEPFKTGLHHAEQ